MSEIYEYYKTIHSVTAFYILMPIMVGLAVYGLIHSA